MSGAGGSAPVPEVWIGRAVELIFISGGSTEYTDGDLEEVNDRGIVVSVETHVGHPPRLRMIGARPCGDPAGGRLRG